MTMRRKIQIISPPNDQLAGVYLPNNLAEQWRSILRLVYPVGISRDFNLVPIPENPNNDQPWGDHIKYNSYLLFPHRKGITSKEFCLEFREFCKSFNNTFVYDSTGVTRTMFPWTAIGTAVETKTNNISNMTFSVTRTGRITAIDFAEFGYVDVDAIKQTEHFLSLLWSDCRIIATDISPLIPAKDANPMIITLANKDNWGDAIAELKDFIRLQTGHQTFSTATSEIFKDEAFSEEGGAWKIDIGHAIEKAEDDKKVKDMTEVKIYNTHGVLGGLNFANGVKMSNDVVDQWVTVMKSAYPAIIPSAVRLLKLIGNPNCGSKYNESVVNDSYLLIPQSDIGGIYYTKVLDAINAKLLHKSYANDDIEIPWTGIQSQLNTILVGVSRPYRVSCFDLHDIRGDEESKNEIRRFFRLISDDCEMTVVDISALINIDDNRRPLIVTLSTKESIEETIDDLENFVRAKTGRCVTVASMGKIFGYENGSWRLDVGGIIKHEEEEKKVEESIRQLFIDGESIPTGVAAQWRSILQRVYNDTRVVGNFYLIPLSKREDYEGPAYNDDMLNQSYMLSPDATFGSATIHEISKELLCGETETRTKEMPWSQFSQYGTLTVAMSSDSLITHIRPAAIVIGSANFRNKIEEGFNRFLQLINRSDCILIACDLSFICESSEGYRPMIITFTKGGSAINTINDLTDFVSTTMGISVDTIVPTEDGAMIATFETEEEVDSNHCVSGPRGLTSKSIKIYTVSVKLTAMNTPPVPVKLDVTAEDETEALEVAKQQLKLYFKNESIPVYPKVIAESVYDLVSERPILDK